jgi:hypothetical protein
VSFLKYLDELKQENRSLPESEQLHFGRLMEDGMPFRGRPVPLREDEFEEYSEVDYDTDVRLFDVTNETERRELKMVLDKTTNNVYVMHRMREELVPQRDGSVRAYVYCVWSGSYTRLNQQRLIAAGIGSGIK